MRTIVYSPNSVLETPSILVEKFDASLLELCEDMIEIMFKHNGIGISAPQINELQRVIAFMPLASAQDYPKPPRILVNPVIISYSERFTEEWEGCLSLPGLIVKISRPSWIEVHYQDEYGIEYTEKFDNLSSRIIQHEINHLDGILISQFQSYNNVRLLTN